LRVPPALRAETERYAISTRYVFAVSVLLSLGPVAHCACRDCAQSPLGGPAANRFTAYDSAGSGVWVNLSNLTLFVRATDLSFDGFSLERSWNQDDSRAGPFGIGWTFNLGDSISIASDGTVVLRRGSGRIDRFALSSNGVYFALTPTADSLAKNSGGTYTLRTPGSTATLVFTSDGRLSAMRDVALDYDDAGRLITASNHGRKMQFAYDAAGHITSVSDSAGRTVNYTYTSDGRLQSTDIHSYQYDDSGNLTAVDAVAVGYTGDPGYTAVASAGGKTYDTPLRPSQIRATDANGDATLYVSSAAGLLVSVTDAGGNTLSYTYDTSGRRTSVVNALGQAARFTYDSNGNLTAIADAAGNRWSADYTGASPAHLTDPNGNVWSFQYDSAGNLSAAADPAGGSLTAARNAAGQIATITNALGNVTAYTYDSDGLVTGFTGALGGKWTYAYDGAARVSTRTDPGGGVIQASDVPVPPPPCVPDPGCTDAFGNSFTADANGRIASVTLPGGNTISYQYDHTGRLAKVADWLGNFAVYRYDAAGWPLSISVSGGPVTAYQYDAAHRLRAVISTGPDGSPVAGYRYTLDGNGNRTAISALEPSTAPASAQSYTFAFDAAGHPVTRSDGESYQYDARGNLAVIAGGRNLTFAYDGLGRLAGLSGDVSTTYTYSSGLRTGRVVNGAERHFDVIGRRVVMETDAAGAPVAWYVYGLGLLWKIAADGTTYFYHFDGDGNVVAVSNPAAGVVNRYRYDAAGQLVTADETVENSFRARGQAGWMDDGNGLLFTGGEYRLPDLRLTLPAAVDLSPPPARLLPPLEGASACFLEGIGNCSFATGRRDQ
jgi:YD repeat-containing protein